MANLSSLSAAQRITRTEANFQTTEDILNSASATAITAAGVTRKTMKGIEDDAETRIAALIADADWNEINDDLALGASSTIRTVSGYIETGNLDRPAIISSGGIADLTTPQQDEIEAGREVLTTDGWPWRYIGGTKTDEASYTVPYVKKAIEEVPSITRFGFRTGVDNDDAYDELIDHFDGRTGRVVVPEGTWTHSTGKTLPAGLSLDLNPGAVIEFDGTSGDAALRWGTGGVDEVTVTANVAPGAYSLSVASGDQVLFAPGDIVKLKTTKVYSAARTPDIKRGELLVVRSVADGSVVFYTPVFDSYLLAEGTVKLELMDAQRGVGVKGGKFIASGVDNGLFGIRFRGAIQPLVHGVEFDGFDQRAISFEDCIAPGVEWSRFYNAEGSSSAYGVSFADATRDAKAFFNYFLNVRHAVSTNNFVDTPGIVRFVKAWHNVIDFSAPALGGTPGDAMDTHACADNCDYSYNIIRGATGNGINAESRTFRAVGNKIYDPLGGGIWHYNWADDPGSSFLKENEVYRAGNDAIRLGGYLTGNSTQSAVLERADVIRNKVDTCTGLPMYLRSFAPTTNKNGKLVCERNVLEGGTSTSAALYIDGWDEVVDEANEIEQPVGHGIRARNVTKLESVRPKVNLPSASTNRAYWIESTVAASTLRRLRGTGAGGTGLYIDDGAGPVEVRDSDLSAFSTPVRRGSGTGHDIIARGYDTVQEATIASGSITPRKDAKHIRVLGEGATADNLDTMDVSNMEAGDILILSPGSASQTITVRDTSTGSGIFRLAGDADFAMSTTDTQLLLYFTGTVMREIARSAN